MKSIRTFSLLLFLLAGCYASTIIISESQLYSVKVTNMLEGYAAPELYLDFSKDPIFLSKQAIARILNQEFKFDPNQIPSTLIDDLQKSFNSIAKHFYIRLDTKFGYYDSYCLGVAYQNNEKCIMVQNFSKSGVLTQGTLYPFQDKDWATKAIDSQLRYTNIYNLSGDKIIPVYKKIGLL